MNGVIIINKPAGISSRAAVDVVKRLLPKKTKLGHAGTLDPMATGVLVVCIGRATRLIEYIQRMRKQYRGTFLLGRSSRSLDIQEPVTVLESPPVPTAEQFELSLKDFTGEISQVPPEFSAVKVNGKRAYALARAGDSFELKPKMVQIHQLKLDLYEYPEFVLNIECGSGTYVRSLAHDIAKSLGTNAVMSALVRSAIGGFLIEDGLDIGSGKIEEAEIRERLLPMSMAVTELPSIELSSSELIEIQHGRKISKRANLAGEIPDSSDEIAAFDDQKNLIAILKTSKEPAFLQPTRVLKN